MEAREIAGRMNHTKRAALLAIASYDKGRGYPWCWKTKTREKLQAEGLVGQLRPEPSYGEACHLTDLGREVAKLLEASDV